MGTREQVCSMRHQGVRSAEIARALGISRQRVSQLCKQEAITGRNPQPLCQCVRCGADIGRGRPRVHRFCSHECRYAKLRATKVRAMRAGRAMRLGPDLFRLRRAGLTWAEIAVKLGLISGPVATAIARRYATYSGADTRGVIAKRSEPHVYNRTRKAAHAQAGA